MGRKRIPEEDRKVNINLRIDPKLKQELIDKKVNSSKLFESASRFFLNQIKEEERNNRNK